jgi:hypothetical protein
LGSESGRTPSLPPGSPPLFHYENSVERRSTRHFIAVHAVELRPRRAPHEVALIIRDAVRTPCKAAVPGIDAQQLVVRAVPRQQQRQRHIRSVAHVPLMCPAPIMCRSAPSGRKRPAAALPQRQVVLLSTATAQACTASTITTLEGRAARAGRDHKS